MHQVRRYTSCVSYTINFYIALMLVYVQAYNVLNNVHTMYIQCTKQCYTSVPLNTYS